MLKFSRDSELVVSQVRSRYATKNKRLKKYMHAIWESNEFFYAFSIDWIEREKNIMELMSDDVTLVGMSQVEIKSRPSIPDNIHNWQVFEDDDGILKFIQCIDRYETQEIDFNAL